LEIFQKTFKIYSEKYFQNYILEFFSEIFSKYKLYSENIHFPKPISNNYFPEYNLVDASLTRVFLVIFGIDGVQVKNDRVQEVFAIYASRIRPNAFKSPNPKSKAESN